MKTKTIKLISGIITIAGIIWFIKGDYTNGLLTMILGELTDIEKIK